MHVPVTRRAVLTGVPLLVAACGSQRQEFVVAMGPASAEVRVGLLDYFFRRSAKELLATTVTLTVTNVGSTAHDLKVLDGDRVVMETRVLQPGAEQQISADLAGLHKVTFLCTVPGHRAQGMVEDVPVVAAPSGSIPTFTATTAAAKPAANPATTTEETAQ